MSPAWLADILGQDAGALRTFTASKVGTGQMCDSFRLALDWADGVDTAPATVVAKCPSHDEASRNIRKAHRYLYQGSELVPRTRGGSGVAAPDCRIMPRSPTMMSISC